MQHKTFLKPNKRKTQSLPSLSSIKTHYTHKPTRSPSSNPISTVPLLFSRFTHNHHNSASSTTITTTHPQQPQHTNHHNQTISNPQPKRKKTILKICDCPKLKSLLNFIPITPLQKFEIWRSPILDERCKSSGR